MPNYAYTAKSFDGVTISGTLQADSQSDLAKRLRSQNMMLVKVSEERVVVPSRMLSSLPFFGVSATEKIMMTRNMGVMFSTGLSMVKIFDILATQSKRQSLKAALGNIKERINKGENLSDALAYYPDIFSELFCNMIKVGEESGTLDDIFQILSLQLGKEHELKSRIKNAMIYPSIILLVMVVIGGVIVTVVLPSLSVFFTALNADIPIYTKVLLATGDFLTKRWYVVLAGLIAAALMLWSSIRTPKGKWILDTVLLKIPAVSPIVKKNNAAGMVRSLSSLIASGVSLDRALEITSKLTGNHYFKQAIISSRAQIIKGEKLSKALKNYQHLFPLGIVEMVEVGEETGKTAEILKKLADFYEQEAINAIEKLTIIIEPLLIIVLGLGVGFFAFSIIQPMYSSFQAFSQ